jgi:RHS repeat-associated protein
LKCTGSFQSGTRNTGTRSHGPSEFTGKERDSESGLDNFGARFDASSLGRFMSPDPKIMSIRHIVNPQKWNKYAYTLNNPLTYFDPDGQEEKSLLAKIADVFHVQGSVGVGIGVTVKIAGVNIRFEASMKSQGQVSAAGNLTVSVVKEAGVTAGITGLGEVGIKKGSETTTVKDNKVLDNFETKSTDVVGAKAAGRSFEETNNGNSIELVGGNVCLGACLGGSVGVDLEKADVAASAIADKIADKVNGPVAPPPPPQPPPPPPTCTPSGDKKCS